MQSQTNIAFLIAIGCLTMLMFGTIIILFVMIYQRKMLEKETKIKFLEQEKQVLFFKATVEAEENQKEKIARNLHDEISPLLTVLKLNLSKAERDIKQNSFSPDNLRKDKELIDKVIEGIRTTCRDLIPSFFLEFGLVNSLEDFLVRINDSQDISTSFDKSTLTDNYNSLTKFELLNVYRTCIEIINNILKHAKCSQLKIIMVSSLTDFTIEFIHNGKGISNKDVEELTKTEKGLGIKSIQTRVLILNGKLDYQTNINSSLVKLKIPTRTL